MIADRLSLAIDGAAGIIAARVACHLLQDQALVGTNYSCSRVVWQNGALVGKNFHYTSAWLYQLSFYLLETSNPSALHV